MASLPRRTKRVSLDTRRFVLALYVASGYFALTGLLYFVTVPNENTAPINTLLGGLQLAFGGIIGYIFGRSGSADALAREAEMRDASEAEKSQGKGEHT